jgi:hypothetical protein
MCTNVTWRPMRETQLQKLHLCLDPMCLNPEHINPTLVLRKYQTEWLEAHHNPFPSYTLCPLATTILQQILYNVISHFTCWALYCIYTYISASFIPWNLFKSAWLLNSKTIYIYIHHKTIILVCKQEILYNKHCVLQLTLAKLLSWRCHITSLHTKLYVGGLQ